MPGSRRHRASRLVSSVKIVRPAGDFKEPELSHPCAGGPMADVLVRPAQRQPVGEILSEVHKTLVTEQLPGIEQGPGRARVTEVQARQRTRLTSDPPSDPVRRHADALE